jgi:hypothetical protein
MVSKSIRFGVIALAMLPVFAVDASAQQLYRGDTVLTRPRPELDPLGVRLGSFFLFPRAGVVESFNDNIFATEHDKENDFITQLQPSASLESNWTRHAWNLGAEADFGLYAKNNGENYQDFAVATDGRIDITRDQTLNLGGGVAKRHEERDNPDSIRGGKDPTVFYQYDSFASYYNNFGRINGTFNGAFLRRDYDDTDTFAGPNINNDDRDRNDYTGDLRVGYEIVPEYEAFVSGGANRRKYDTTPDDGGVDRDSWGWGVNLGVAFDISGITVGDFFIGWRQQNYSSDKNLNNTSGLNVGTSVDWNVTTLTTVGARVARTIEETTEAGASGYFATAGLLTVDHELLRNLLLNASFGVTNNDYEGIRRNDFIYNAGVGGEYLMNRYVTATLGYTFRRRDSHDAPGGDQDYTENVVRLGIAGHL